MTTLSDTTAHVLSLNPWQSLKLTNRAAHVLEHHQIGTLAELIRYTPTRLRKLHGCGAVSVMEIRQELLRLGLDLKPEPPDEG